MPGTRKLGRPTAHRMAMLKTMVTDVLDKGRITTTYTRAMEVAPLVEKMITLGKQDTVAARRQAMITVKREDVVRKLFSEIAPALSKRDGGYTRISRLGFRRGDAAEIAVLELLAE